ncbi:Tyrosine aminotransferase [Brachionus plicatilis]|uniref:Tyrosine aminotransferase n=1 Tax=Brachionus plicatilis TaxID=10195 RepID=A0A3M7RQ02_BRAPC|nr:Tyrosine aminotransferase [Brachionus plicatilis]
MSQIRQAVTNPVPVVDANNNSKELSNPSEFLKSDKNVNMLKKNSYNQKKYTLSEKCENESDWSVEVSDFAKSTCNPVRKLIEQMKIEPNPNYQMIALSIGDPTVFSEIGKPQSVINAVQACINDKKFDGYTPSYGTEAARQAVAKYYSRPDNLIYKFTDILLTNGCSQAIDLCITVLANRGDNIVIPKPGFSIYKTLAGTLGINVKYYSLLEEFNWEVDLEELESLIDERTKAIIVNNPSNPCGSVYSREHLLDIIDLAERYKLPIIADEVYGDMVFPGNEFYYMSELTQRVPILSCNALSKRFILPGWRFGWIAIHDPKNYLARVRAGFNDLTTRILGPNSLAQAAVVEILEKTPQSYFDGVMQILSINAEIVYERVKKLPGLIPRKPSGAMYMMVGLDLKCFPDIPTDLEFVQMLIREKSVFCLPANIFECPNYIRIVITMKKEKIIEACERIEEFVLAHYKPCEKK